jgi:hypothetical protein
MQQCGKEQISSWVGLAAASWRVLHRGAGTDVVASVLFTHWRHTRRVYQLLAGAVEPGKIPPEMIDVAAAIAGISITAEQKTMMLYGLEGLQKSVATIRGLKLPNSMAPAFVFKSGAR